jgi:hypothetical protein
MLPTLVLLVPWSDAAFVSATLDQMAIGPDWFLVDPQGQLFWYSPLNQSLYGENGEVIETETGAESGLFLPDGSLLLLQGRSLWYYDRLDAVPEQLSLPALAPSGPLSLREDLICVEDVFRNCHGIFSPSPAGLIPIQQRLPPEVGIRRQKNTDGSWSLMVGGKSFAKADVPISGYLLGDWVVVEERWPDHMERYGLALGNPSEKLSLNPEPSRLYAPTQDLLAGLDGQLYWMSPLPSGLSFYVLGAP